MRLRDRVKQVIYVLKCDWAFWLPVGVIQQILKIAAHPVQFAMWLDPAPAGCVGVGAGAVLVLMMYIYRDESGN